MKLSESEASVKQAQAAQGDIDQEDCTVGPNLPAVALSSSSKRCKFEGKKVIISIHIPKTGGTAFLQILKPVATEILYLDYGNQVFSPNALYRHGQKVHETFESFGDLERFPGRSVIHGHFHSGKYLKRFPRAAYITWLRDPVERVASHYFFWQRDAIKQGFTAEPLCNKVISEKLSLVEFAQLERVRNVQHRFLSTIGIDRCDFIGITEEYDRGIRLFRTLFCPEMDFAPQTQKQNRNPHRPLGGYALEKPEREKIRGLNELDVGTYEQGLRRFRMLCDEVGI